MPEDGFRRTSFAADCPPEQLADKSRCFCGTTSRHLYLPMLAPHIPDKVGQHLNQRSMICVQGKIRHRPRRGSSLLLGGMTTTPFLRVWPKRWENTWGIPRVETGLCRGCVCDLNSTAIGLSDGIILAVADAWVVLVEVLRDRTPDARVVVAEGTGLATPLPRVKIGATGFICKPADAD